MTIDMRVKLIANQPSVQKICFPLRNKSDEMYSLLMSVSLMKRIAPPHGVKMTM